MSDAAIHDLIEFGKFIGFPAVIALGMMFLFYLALKLMGNHQAISAQQTEILGGLSVHVTEVAERTESHTQKLDRIHGMLERGVCRRVNE